MIWGYTACGLSVYGNQEASPRPTPLGLGPSPAAAAPQPRFAMLPVSLEPTGLPHGDCEMEDLTSGPLGTFVLVQ